MKQILTKSESKFDIDMIPFSPIPNPKFEFIDIFAGIGGFRIAMQNLGGKCVFTSEWDKYAKQTYEASPATPRAYEKGRICL